MSAARMSALELDPLRHSRLLCSLAQEAREHPLEAKLIICRRRGVGREILHALTLAAGGWVGFGYNTPLQLASRLVADTIAAEGLTRLDDLGQMALLDEAIDRALAGEEIERFQVLAESTGFRAAVRSSINDLRLAGIGTVGLGKAALGDREKQDVLTRILHDYESLHDQRGMADDARILRLAVSGLESGETSLPEGRIYILPGLEQRGLVGQLLGILREQGATVLPADPVFRSSVPAGLVAPVKADPSGRLSFLNRPAEISPTYQEPAVELFAAASPAEELREVLRRCVARGVRWDEVEIIATDPVVYGSTLDSLATHLGVEVTHAAGLPVWRTRTGRAVSGYLRWVQEDFPAEIPRALLQSGILSAPADGETYVGGARLARRLRGLRIGWGRQRYLKQVDWALEAMEEPPAADDERSPEEIESYRQRRRQDLEALRMLFEPILEAIPEVPDRFGTVRAKVSPADLAAGLLRFLDFVPARREIEREAQSRLRRRLRRVQESLKRESSMGAALATLRNHIEVRVPSPASGDKKQPWSSAGGHLHFSDIAHGGLSGRRHTFIVGLHASSPYDSDRQDPLLVDGDRRRIDPFNLATSDQLLAERRYLLAALLASLRGSVTLSYSAWESSEGRSMAPSPVMLQAFRLASADPNADYEALHRTLRPLVSIVPHEATPIDSSDVWLANLSHRGVFFSASDQVRAAFPRLDRGLDAARQRLGEHLTSYQGAVTPRPELLDPRVNEDIVLSASRLEMLGQCPLRYFFRHVLHVQPPDQIEFTLDEWLTPMEKGSLLHSVYERVLREAVKNQIHPSDDRFPKLADEVLAEEITLMRHRVPPPSDVVFEAEREGLRMDMRVFVRIIRREKPRWAHLEIKFGLPGGKYPAVELEVPGGAIRLRGAIDRIDEVSPGKIRVIDYKTGGARRYSRSAGVYHGGRRLQHALYSAVAERILERTTETMEYQFPTRLGQGDKVPFRRADLEDWPEIVGALIELVERGTFVPTDDPKDCSYCDYQAVCRAKRDDYGNPSSPPAAWGNERCDQLEVYEPLRRARGEDR
jgi:ATP-dependent helicase/nuclease subunit B